MLCYNYSPLFIFFYILTYASTLHLCTCILFLLSFIPFFRPPPSLPLLHPFPSLLPPHIPLSSILRHLYTLLPFYYPISFPLLFFTPFLYSLHYHQTVFPSPHCFHTHTPPLISFLLLFPTPFYYQIVDLDLSGGGSVLGGQSGSASELLNALLQKNEA